MSQVPRHHEPLGAVDARIYSRRASECLRAGDTTRAIEWLDSGIALFPSSATLRVLLAAALGGLGRHSDAERELRTALQISPTLSEAHCNLGVALEHMERHEEAVQYQSQAVRLRPACAPAWTNLSNALRKAWRPREALVAADNALRFAEPPQAALAHNARGAALLDLARAGEAVISFEKATSLTSSHPEADVNLAMSWLALGRWREGFRAFECRFEHPVWRRSLPGERWNAPPLNSDLGAATPPRRGSTILLYGEGGLGNGIQFARFASQVANADLRVVIECRAELAPLLHTLPGVASVVGVGQPVDYQYYAALMSLPALLGVDQTNAAADGPYLSAEPVRVAKWDEFLRPQRAVSNGQAKPLLVGVSWQGEQRPAFRRNRSFPAAMLARLAHVPGVRLVSLQKGCTFDGSFPMIEPPGLDEHGGAFLDTAALMMHLDLIISCDTSIAHLAGALARPTWVALPFAADWRWMQKREDTPWYPTMRLFRQTSIGDWDGVFERIARELSMLHDRPR